MYKLKIENKEYPIKDGFVINDELNEKLDSGTIQFLDVGNVSNIEQFDNVVLFGEDKQTNMLSRKKLLVDTFEGEIANFDNNDIFKSDFLVTSNLMSESKGLERITLPNLKITQRRNSTVSVWEKIKQYCKTYVPKVYVFDKDQRKVVLRTSLMYDKELETIFNKPCPEFTWNNATLKEVLSDLFSTADLIPIVKDNVLTYFDITKVGNEIDQTKLTNAKFRGTSVDYCDTLTLPMQNVIQTKKTRCIEYLSMKTDGVAEMSTESACFITQKPIYNIIRCTAYVKFRFYTSGSPTNLFGEFDITNSIKEKGEYDILSPRKKYLPVSFDPHDYQAFNLFYVRGDNKITEVGKSETFRIGTSKAKLHRVLSPYIADRYASVTSYEDIDFPEDVRDIFITLEYETIDEGTLKVGKSTEIKHPNNALFDGQNSSTVDLKHQTIHEYLKVNRLGNKVYTIFGEYEKESDIPQLADHIGNKILFSRSITYYDNIIMFMGELTDSYILTDYFTAINSERRSWQIASEKESSVRHDTIKFFLNVGTSAPKEIDTSASAYSVSGNLNEFANLFNQLQNLTTIQNVFIKTESNGVAIPSDTKWYQVDANINNGGMSNFVTFGLNTNSLAGYSAHKESTSDYLIDPLSYVDENGEFDTFKIAMTFGYNYGESEFDFNYELGELEFGGLTTARYEKVVGATREKPLVDEVGFTNKQLEIVEKLYKDNREQIKQTVQFEYCTDTPNVVLTDKIANLTPLFNETGGERKVRIFLDRNGTLSPSQKLAKGISTNFDFSVSDNCITIDTKGQLIEENDVLYFVSMETMDFYVAVKGFNKLYFDVRYTNDNNIYNSVIDKVQCAKLSNTMAEIMIKTVPQMRNLLTTINVLGRELVVEDLGSFDL